MGLDQKDIDRLRQLAGKRVFGRGKEYHDREAVAFRDVSKGAARAVVRGSVPYIVDLSFGEDGVNGVCTCPYSKGRFVCKHVVAAALAWQRDPPPRSDTMLVAGYLDGLSREALQELLWKAADRDARLFSDLAIEAITTAASNEDVALALARLTDDALDAIYDGRRGAEDLFLRVLSGMEEVLGRGMAAEVAECAWRAAGRIAEEGEFPRDADAGGFDEGDGDDGISEAYLVRALSMHARACEALGRSAEEVARLAFPVAAGGDGGKWGQRFEAYLHVFGKPLAAEWAELALRQAGPSGL